MKRLLLLSLVVLYSHATIDGLDLTQENSVTQSELQSSELTQGSLIIEESLVSDSYIEHQSSVDDVRILDGSRVQQSMAYLLDGSHIQQSQIALRATISNAEFDAASLMRQSNLLVHESTVDDSIIQSNGVAKNILVNDSTIHQGSIYLVDGSEIKNGSSIHTTNQLEGVSFEHAVFSQGEIISGNSKFNGVVIESNNIFSSKDQDSKVDSGMIIQNRNFFRESQLSHSTIKTDTSIESTVVRDGLLDFCSMDMRGATLTSTQIERYCQMKESSISNGAVVYHGIMRLD